MSSDEDFQKMLSRLQANVASPKCGKLLYQKRLEFTPGGGCTTKCRLRCHIQFWMAQSWFICPGQGSYVLVL